ncbi:hypothetical protein ACFB49_17450 [Sphingomonas sp. DBB INV C78]|uniref:hypothetical protein n=1 Tax=Sphingomonas sp. DBB INV C78 TaxID=3349434 RepID=UPI0036D27FF7
MDRRGRGARFLIAAGVAVLSGLAVAAVDPPLRAAHWLTPEARPRALVERPAECFAAPADTVTRASAEIGRAAFRTPLLLGGQAARVGLTCESCHRAGRGNADFHFPGLSGTPGTADVTSSLMSSHRGNQRFDPKPIPDLAMPGKVSHDPASPALRTFIHGLVVEEFDGTEPPPRVLDGLAAYVRALDIRHCGQAGPIRLADQLGDLDRARKAADSALHNGDGATARLMIAAMRTALGQIDERYAIHGLERHRNALRAADAQLQRFQRELDSDGRAPDLDGWMRASHGWVAALRRDEAQSLYNADLLRKAYATPGS